MWSVPGDRGTSLLLLLFFDPATTKKTLLLDYILWRGRVGVPSKCTIVRATEMRQRRSRGVLVEGRKTKKQNPKPTLYIDIALNRSGQHCNKHIKRLHSVKLFV